MQKPNYFCGLKALSVLAQKDLTAAVEWMEKAAAGGDDNAAEYLELLKKQLADAGNTTER